jgi:hypothetical protein
MSAGWTPGEKAGNVVDVLTPDAENIPYICGFGCVSITTLWVLSPFLAGMLGISAGDFLTCAAAAVILGFLVYLSAIRPRVVDM